jgi:hypothetical protein
MCEPAMTQGSGQDMLEETMSVFGLPLARAKHVTPRHVFIFFGVQSDFSRLSMEDEVRV